MLLKIKNIAIGGIVIIGIIAIASIVIFHKPQPTHNPFDNVFNVSIDRLLEEGYTFRYDGCGYNLYYKTTDSSEIYYQVFPTYDNPEQIGDIAAKGCDIILDTLCKDCLTNTEWLVIKDSLFNNFKGYKSTFDSLYKMDSSLISKRLKSFGVSLIDTSFKQGQYGFWVRHIPTDSLFLCSLEISLEDGIRSINMQQSNPKPFSQKPVIKFFTSLFNKEQDESEKEQINEYTEE